MWKGGGKRECVCVSVCVIDRAAMGVEIEGQGVLREKGNKLQAERN